MKILFALVLLMLTGCGRSHNCVSSRSYVLNTENSSTVGSPIIQTGCMAAEYQPRWLQKLIWKTEPYADNYYRPKIEQELLYSGIDKDILHISYREYTYEGLAKSSFYQQVSYDLNKSKSIVFQDWAIDITEADNMHLKYIVTKEPKRVDQSYLSSIVP